MVYKGALGNQSLAATPIDFYKATLLYRLQSEGKFLLKVYQEIISIPIQELALSKIETNNRQEIQNIFNKLIEWVSKKLENKIINTKRRDMALCLYSLATYMTKLHYYMDFVVRGQLSAERIYSAKSFDEKEKNILFYVFANKDKWSHVFYTWRGLDKAVIQTLFYHQGLNKDEGLTTINMDYLTEIYNYATALVSLVNEREFVTSGYYQNPVLSVQENKIEIIGVDEATRINNLLKNASDSHYEVESIHNDIKLLSALDAGLFNQYGFRVRMLDKAFGGKFSSLDLGVVKADVVIIEHKKFVDLLRREGNCSRQEAEKAIAYLKLRDNVGNNRFGSIETYESRLLEQPVVDYDANHYLFSFYLMMYAITLLKHKMVYDLIELKNNPNSKFIKKKIKAVFEKKVFDAVTPYMDHFALNFRRLRFTNSEKSIEINLKYEFDIVALKDKKLYVFECKDVTHKFTSYGLRHDINKTMKFINKISNKLIEIRRYQKEIEHFFGSPFNDIVPVLVFKHYNAIEESDISTNGIRVLSFSELNDWLITSGSA
ncbi:hypothetical protein [Cohnella sp. GbtcB17]|uniref:hypothetical protein n=1 Tax=Cohnella sp. GbtcB17 TaxID=2824762 RepID=UPI001C30A1D1|nr:hypothetical protein [Cohnella sp. GbtcB17]